MGGQDRVDIPSVSVGGAGIGVLLLDGKRFHLREFRVRKVIYWIVLNFFSSPVPPSSSVTVSSH